MNYTWRNGQLVTFEGNNNTFQIIQVILSEVNVHSFSTVSVLSFCLRRIMSPDVGIFSSFSSRRISKFVLCNVACCCFNLTFSFCNCTFNISIWSSSFFTLALTSSTCVFCFWFNMLHSNWAFFISNWINSSYDDVLSEVERTWVMGCALRFKYDGIPGFRMVWYECNDPNATLVAWCLRSRWSLFCIGCGLVITAVFETSFVLPVNT